MDARFCARDARFLSNDVRPDKGLTALPPAVVFERPRVGESCAAVVGGLMDADGTVAVGGTSSDCLFGVVIDGSGSPMAGSCDVP